MSMILMRTDLANDMRVIRLSDLTDAKVGAIIGGLHAVWSAAQTLSTDGFIRYMTASRIDRLAEVDGFAAAMVDVGWLKVTPDGAEFPDFDAYFGKSSKTRAIDRLRKNRDRKGAGKGGRPDTPRTQSGQNSDKTRTDSGHVRAPACAPTHDKGKERNGSERKESHLPPGGGEREGDPASESGELSHQAGHPGTARDSAGQRDGASTIPHEPDPGGFPSPTSPSPAFQGQGQGSGAPRPPTQQKPSSAQAFSQRHDDMKPGLSAFLSLYPKGRAKNRTAIRAAWDAQGCESNPEPVMAGLARWVKCEEWAGGFVDKAETFLQNGQWGQDPPDPKRRDARELAAAKAIEGAARVRSAEETFAAFEKLPRAEREALMERVYLRAPGLRGLPVGADVVKVEVFKELREAVMV